MTDSELEDLFKRYERGLCTAEEEELINRWLDSGGKGQNAFQSQVDEARAKTQLLNSIHDEIDLPEKKQKQIFLTFAKIAAVVIIGLGAGFWLLKDNADVSQSISKVTPSPSNGSYEGKQFVQLSDGTAITMNEGSSLSFDFSGDTREISLKGEAFFDVAHDKTKPFMVHTGDVVTEVLGTAFNINSNDKKVIVTVTRGKVKVGDSKKVYGELLPQQQLTVDAVDHSFAMNADGKEPDQAVAWKREYFIFDGVPMWRAAELMAEQFNVEVVITNESIRNCEVSGRFINNESLEEVLALFSTMNETTFTVEGDLVTINGGVSCGE